jgi:hypothetical protein
VGTKGIIVLGIVAMMLTLTAFTWPVSPLTTPVNGYTAASIQMTITINGLTQGETATLLIGPETPDLEVKNALFEHQVNGTGVSIKEEIAPVLEDGNYLLLLGAPSHYFRKPKGYFINVRDSAIVNPTGKAIIFNLEPPPTYLATEGVADLSAPPKQPIPIIEPPLWQRLLEPAAISLAVIVVALIAVFIWRRRSRTEHRV